ncbi:outer membrane transport energization protein TonB (TC 2.C.1.1.1) [Bosea sp. OK403]|uniref:energy transducer TonB family protein n=1 Tax=Bosea sp. OK403 TaxID=1855286 RepID=UPI0008F0C37C|nr:energy transducer TonB [Bosea sp. OK403]SFJ83864.1 outer membrane transport energization protein TonB (TC 2.C.1.1.1) [Bosea sp. OK403]
MSMGRDVSVSRFWPGALRWSVAALVVASAHAGAGWMILNWQQAEAAMGEPPAAVMIELAPIAVAPETPPQEVAPGPEMVEAQPEPAPERVVEKPPEETPREPEPVVTPVEPTPEVPLPVMQPEPGIKLPEMPQIADAPVVLPPPPPPPRPVVQRKPPPPKPRMAERHKPVEPGRPQMRQTSAPPSAQAQTAPSMAAPSAGAASAPSVSPASWRGTLIAHLNRYKRFPGGASPGTVQVAFSIDRGGRVLSARLAGSSGDTILDEEAVAMVRRASPVPAPPQGVGGGTIALAVPVRFSR